MKRSLAHQPCRHRFLPVLRRLLAVVLALSFATLLSVPSQAMGPHCPEPQPDHAASVPHVGQSSTMPQDVHLGHHSGHAAKAEARAPLDDAPQPKADSHMACCLAACPACLPALTTAPALLSPAQARRIVRPPNTRLPAGLPPAEALDPPRSATA